MINSQELGPPKIRVGIIGCIGGFLMHIVIGSFYMWGNFNVYVTSYYHIRDQSVTLESNAIVFPVMMLCVGLTMKLGVFLSGLTHPLIVMGGGQILNALMILISSFMPNNGLFILFYGVFFGLSIGLNFINIMYQCNKYLVGKKMYVNGFILAGTGLGTIVFSLTTYAFLNPNQLKTLNGYYNGTPQLQEIANLVPVLLRYLSLMYICIGTFGLILISPVCLYNRRKQNLEEQKKQLQELPQQSIVIQHDSYSAQNSKREAISSIHTYKKEAVINNQSNLPPNEAHSIKQAVKSKVFWIVVFIVVFGACGSFLVNGNYKTYVKSVIQDDKFLTTVGVVGSVGNGCSRFFWNLFFLKTGYKTAVLCVMSLAVIILSTIRFTVQIKVLYLLEIFLMNCCMGGFMVLTPTVALYIYGLQTGSNIYGIYWEAFGVTNFIGYLLVSQLSKKIGFNALIYIVLGMLSLAIPVVILTKFQGPWGNSTVNLEYFYWREEKKYAEQVEEKKQQSINKN